jgi:cytoskeletal protein RodZ
MPQERSDPVWLDDVEAPLEHRSPKRLCIISGDALPSGEFIAALQTAVGPNQEIEIIRERRRGGSGIGPGQPPVDRRRLPHVEALVKMDGYAIVPLPASQSRPPRIPDPPMPFPPIEHRSAEPRPAERPPFARHTFDDDGDADERELERILQFKQRRKGRLGLPLVVAAALVAVLIVLLVQLPAVKSLMSRAATPPAERTSEAPQSTQAPAPATPSSSDRSSQTPPPAGREDAERPPEPTDTPRAPVDTAPPPQTSPVPRAQAQTSPVPRAETRETRPQTGPVAGLPPAAASRVSPRQTAVARAPETLRGESSRFPGVPRVELTRNSLATPEGKAESYVVRLSDPAGRPLAGADVLLLARMADGTVESIMLRDGLEPGTYSGTSRPTPSAPVDLRVRMTMSDKRIEVPLRP